MKLAAGWSIELANQIELFLYHSIELYLVNAVIPQ